MDRCPICGLAYDAFRSGLTYAEVYAQFWVDDDDPSTWCNKRRRTVLGRWHELKLDLWTEHLDACGED